MYRPNKLMRVAIVAAAGSMVLAGCGGSSDKGSTTTPKKSGVQLYFVDGNTANYSGVFDKGTLYVAERDKIDRIKRAIASGAALAGCAAQPAPAPA